MDSHGHGYEALGGSRAELGLARRDFAEWIWAWQRTVVCRLPFPHQFLLEHGERDNNVGRFIEAWRDRLDHIEAFRRLESEHARAYQLGRRLTLALIEGRPVSVLEFDGFVAATHELFESFCELEIELAFAEAAAGRCGVR